MSPFSHCFAVFVLATLALGQECDRGDECFRGSLLNSDIVDDQAECQEFCEGVNGCELYTFYFSSNFCNAFRSCSEYADCDDYCVTSDVECPVGGGSLCNEPFKCQSGDTLGGPLTYDSVSQCSNVRRKPC